ncbi:TIGR03668 family PPOX class F420-dependent oxidoreductase [Sporichthya polymorpha]|uniref:TIGR03668 family PPOX class F420-dependent oxidoreductase n=1 Tax=Sporichthya polymorpha TaxID=35751 RepID=UPI00037B122B
MRRNYAATVTPDEARTAFASARVVRLATVNAEGVPHLVPITFALPTPDVVVFAVDHKPKTTTALRRLANIAANPAVCLLADFWSEDWTELWWARADGLAAVLGDGDPHRDEAVASLCARYAQYRDRPPAGPVVWIEVQRWSGWTGA